MSRRGRHGERIMKRREKDKQVREETDKIEMS